jgi:hypothetical protein
VTGQHLAGALSQETSRVAVTLLCAGAAPQHFSFSRNVPGGGPPAPVRHPSGLVSSPSMTSSSPLAPEGEFKEMSVARGFWPHVAAQMEVERLCNFQVECVGMLSSRTHGRARAANFVNASEYVIGVFLAEEAVPQSRRGAKLPQRDRRVFLRASVYHKELLLAGIEAPLSSHKRTPSGSFDIDLSSLGANASSVHDDSILADVLGSLELAVGQHGTAWNHVYINMVGTTLEDLPRVEAAIASFINTTFEDLRRLKVSCVEVRVGGAADVVALNTSGLKFKMTSTTHGDPSSASVSIPPRMKEYPLLDKIQRKRMICQNLNSTYAYDFPEIFANVLAERANQGLGRVVELVLDAPGGLAHGGPAGTLIEVERAPGMNDVGMVCWRVRLLTAEYPEGREIILVANDITHMSGSLSPKEDAVYRAAFELSVTEGLPCVYISANSGARIGLDEAVKAAFRVAWHDPHKPSRGFKYLYLSEDDYEMLGTGGRVLCDRVVDETTGEVRFALTDVCGGQGVECLQGSGEIASATSRAYKGAFYTLVPIRPRSRGARRSLRTLSRASLRPPLAFNPRHRRLSTPPDAFQLHPDVALYGTTQSHRDDGVRHRSLRRHRRVLQPSVPARDSARGGAADSHGRERAEQGAREGGVRVQRADRRPESDGRQRRVAPRRDGRRPRRLVDSSVVILRPEAQGRAAAVPVSRRRDCELRRRVRHDPSVDRVRPRRDAA